MILRQAHNIFAVLLLVLIMILAVACMDDQSGNPGPATPTATGSSDGDGTPGTNMSSRTYHPNIRIGPSRGKAGTEVTVIGAGFPPNSEVQIRITGQETGAPNEYITKTEAYQHGNI